MSDASQTPQRTENAGPAVLTELSDGRMTLTLNQADQRNVLSVDIVQGLTTGLTEAAADPSVRVVVVSNAGSVFCAGADLKAARPTLTDDRGTTSNPFVDLLKLIRTHPKPVVARIDGHVTGGGVGLAAVCDLSVMRRDAMIGFTEVRVGVAPAIISVVCLPKMRPGDAAELMLTGERIDATRAAEVGLINYAEPEELLDERVDRLCDSLRQGGPGAVAATKGLLSLVPTMTVDEALTTMAQRSVELFNTDEAAEGMDAFRNRRPPSWAPDG